MMKIAEKIVSLDEQSYTLSQTTKLLYWTDDQCSIKQ